MRRTWMVCHLFLSLLCALGIALPAVAELPVLLPRDVLFCEPDRYEVQLSPDGKSIAYLGRDAKNISQLWIRPVDSDQPRQLTHVMRSCIEDFKFAQQGRSILYRWDNNGDEQYRLCRLDIANGKLTDVMQTLPGRVMSYQVHDDYPDLALVEIVDPNARKIYRVDLQNQRLDLDIELTAPEWVPDAQFHVGACVVYRRDGSRDVMRITRKKIPANMQYFDDQGNFSVSSADREIPQYKRVYHWNRGEQGRLVTLLNHSQNIVLLTNQKSDTLQLVSIDNASGKQWVLASDPENDLMRLYGSGALALAAGIGREQLVWKAIVPEFAEHLDAIRKLQDGMFDIIDGTPALLLVVYMSDRGAPIYYLYDKASKQGKRLFSGSRKLEGLSLAEMKPIAYQARDGLTLHGYLTTPVGVPATGLPLVLLVHGGPWVRDMWGYDPEVQWLANRGYAVLQVNYRGSTGYGRKFYMAGFREWGGKMQNDLTDGVQWAIKQGIADPKRVAIMGASYGGFAVLAGVAFTPDLYVAGVDLCGPPNLCAYAERVAGGTTGYGDEVEAAVGHPVKDHKRLLAHSPLTAAEKIKAPLLIGQGVHDPRITVEESEQMVNTLRQLGKPVEYLRYPDEGHGLARLENRLDFYGHAEQFLTKYLGGRCEPSAK